MFEKQMWKSDILSKDAGHWQISRHPHSRKQEYFAFGLILVFLLLILNMWMYAGDVNCNI